MQLREGEKSTRCTICHEVSIIAAPHCSTTTHLRYPPPATMIPPPTLHGQKRAVICGISYRGSPNELLGCINDARFMKYLLVKRFDFPASSVLMLTDEEIDPYRRPTKNNIRRAMHWLVKGCKAGDSLVFHFSGHGKQQRNYTGDEVDGYDETLCPLDHETKGMIVDDEINATLVNPLPHGVKLHAFIDACHSGTMLDLPYLCNMKRKGKYKWKDYRPKSGTWTGTSGGEVVSFSGCKDNQTATESDPSKMIRTGAMTSTFIKAVLRGHRATYGSILNSMRSEIHHMSNNETVDGRSSLLAMLRIGVNRQEPQLTASQPFDVYSRLFSL